MSSARDRRRQAMIEDVAAAAWELVHEHGLAGLSMRDLGERVGLHASSIYQYFPSKHDIYDALFELGHHQLHAAMADLDRESDPEVVFRAGSAMFTAFCTEDPVRYQLMFQRTIPGFEPAPETWAMAEEGFERLQERLAAAGVTDERSVDLLTAVGTGLTDQQISNDPGGDRWTRLVDEAIEMFFDHVTKTRKSDKRGRTRK